MKDERITAHLKSLRDMLDSGEINAIEFEAARLAVFRQAMMRNPNDASANRNNRLDIPGL